MEIIQSIVPKSVKNVRPGIAMSPKYITIHNTANEKADAMAHAKYLLNGAGGASKSWHFTVDDKVIVQHLPTNEVGWHAGDGRGPGNMSSIGVEICEHKGIDFEKAVQNAAWLVRKLMAEHKIPIHRVVPHKHWTGKTCPRLLLSRWNEFLKMVQDGGSVSANKPNAWTGQSLRKGDKGSAVRDLQVMLQAAGFDTGQPDGVFGAKTETAVKAAQKAFGLEVDGIAGPKTFQALREAIVKAKQPISDGKKYRLLTGTFSSRQDAEAAAEKLRQMFGLTVYVQEEK